MTKKSIKLLTVFLTIGVAVLRIFQLTYAYEDATGLFIKNHPLTLAVNIFSAIILFLFVFAYFMTKKQEKEGGGAISFDGKFQSAGIIVLLLSGLAAVVSNGADFILYGPNFKSAIFIILAILSAMFAMSLLASQNSSQKAEALSLLALAPVLYFSADLILHFVQYTKTPHAEIYNYYILARMGALLFLSYFARFVHKGGNYNKLAAFFLGGIYFVPEFVLSLIASVPALMLTPTAVLIEALATFFAGLAALLL